MGGRGRLEGIIRRVAWYLSLICPEVAQGKDMAKLQRPSTVQDCTSTFVKDLGVKWAADPFSGNVRLKRYGDEASLKWVDEGC